MATFKKSKGKSKSKEKDPELVSLGAHIRQLRTDRSLTQERLAKKAGLHWTYISQVERGTRNMSYKSLRKLAKGLGIKPSRIMPDRPGTKAAKGRKKTSKTTKAEADPQGSKDEQA